MPANYYTGPSGYDRHGRLVPLPTPDMVGAEEDEGPTDVLMAILDDAALWTKDVSAYAMRRWILVQLKQASKAPLHKKSRPAAKKPKPRPKSRTATTGSRWPWQ